jgi:hypothetical protein
LSSYEVPRSTPTAIDDEIDDLKSLSSYEVPRSTPPLASAWPSADWPSADEIDAYNNDLAMAIVEVIVGHTM